VFKKTAKHIELPDGSKFFESKIEADPERFFTPEVLKALDEFCKKKFCFADNDEQPEAVEEKPAA